jgi:Family of unknown function (DUF6339)
MSYPIVKDAVARQWYKTWTESCLDQKPAQRVNIESPAVGTAHAGHDHDWPGIAAKVMEALDVLLSESDATFESEGAIALHEALPDDAALRDPEFWIWLATVPGRSLILKRYPLKEGTSSEGDEAEDEKPSKNPLPDRNNFFGSSARETLFFRLWVRAQMGYAEAEDPWEFVRPGMVDFWRSHVFRQLYAHHRPFLHAFVDFQFPSSPDTDRTEARLNTSKIRILARELSLACANVVIETLDQAQCAALIQRVYEERVPKD